LAAAEELPRTRRSERPTREPGTIDIALVDPIDRARIPALCDRLRGVLECSGAELVLCEVGALVDPDAATIDALARMHLTARRLGCRIHFHRACGELQDLLAFVGLGEVLPVGAALRLDPRGQAEEREHALGVEEEADPTDPIA
jgi:hypothetical protein